MGVGLMVLVLAGCSRSPSDPRSYSGKTNAFLEAANKARAAGALCGSDTYPSAPALAWSDKLAAAAGAHAQDMEAQGYFSHTGLDGSTVSTRVSAQGYQWSRVGENIAHGQPDLDSVMAAWLASPGHCRNLLDPSFTEFGVGQSGTYWVQVFGSP